MHILFHQNRLPSHFYSILRCATAESDKHTNLLFYTQVGIVRGVENLGRIVVQITTVINMYRVFPFCQNKSVYFDFYLFQVFYALPRVDPDIAVGVIIRNPDFVQHQVLRVKCNVSRGGLH